MSPDKFSKRPPAAEQVELTARQAERLGNLTGIAADALRGLTLAKISEQFRHVIPAELLLLRRICGRVVKRDPVTGIDYPVPFATVQVEDTDCSFLGLFPTESPWAWLYPTFCRREVIGTTTTDACGKFCVWVPRFDIDWIVRWRIERFCYPDLLYKPAWRDLLELAAILPKQERVIVRPPRPDPPPDALKDLRHLLPVERLLGDKTVARLNVLANRTQFGEQDEALNELLDETAFVEPIAPPLHKKLLDLHERFQQTGAAAAPTVAANPARFERFDLQHYVGPFLRWHCKTRIFPEIAPIVDVPDITFRVTQDVDGDGTEETIYGESFFDVRWNAGAIPNVTLHAASNAVASLICGQLEPIGCAELGIKVVGEYPLKNPTGVDAYYDPATGYALRPNRPHRDGVDRDSNPAIDPAAAAPFGGMLLLRGCNQAQGAAFYRVKYSLDGVTYVPFLGRSWVNYPRFGGLPTHFAPVDPANGWYAIEPNPGNWTIPDLLLAWPSYAYDNRTYDLVVELADSAFNSLDDLAPVRITVDNARPTVPVKSLDWRGQGEVAWRSLPLTCPVVRRNRGQTIEFRVSWQVSATHLLVAGLGTHGCGSPAAQLVPLSPSTAADLSHWHVNALDNSVSRTDFFTLNYAHDNQGAYTFVISGYSRAFRPDDHGGFVRDWQYDAKIFGGSLDSIQVAVVDA